MHDRLSEFPISNKPVLHPGFELRDNLKVKYRIERVYFTEIYKLSNGRYFFLFLNLNPNEVVTIQKKLELLRISIHNREFVGILSDKYNMQYLFNVLEFLTVPRGFVSIAGMTDLKRVLTTAVIDPFKNPDKFAEFKVTIPTGIILYGPPGCGKTFIVEKIAEELECTFYNISPSDIASTYIHGTVKNIRELFDEAQKTAPSVILFDEIDSLIPNRNQAGFAHSQRKEEISEFLIQLNKTTSGEILVIGTTNHIELIDPAMLRPGRFDLKIYVPPPDFEARIELFRYGLSGRPCEDTINFTHLATLTDGYSSAAILMGIIESAARQAVAGNKPVIEQKMLEVEINCIEPIESHENFEEENFGRYL